MARTDCVILFIVALCAATTYAQGVGAGANASAAIEGSFVQKVFNSLLPTIEADVLALVIPGESEKHFSFDSFSLSSFSVSSIVTSFQSPNIVVAGLNGLSLSVPETHFSVFTHIFKPDNNGDFKISCDGKFWGSISGSDVSLAIAVETLSTGKLQVTSVTPTINFGSVNINHKIDGFLCQIGQDIIQLFLGSLNKYITNIAENDLPGIISSTVQNAANNALPNVPVNFISQPLIVNDTLQLSVELLPPMFSAPFTPQIPNLVGPQSGWVPQVFTDSDIEIGINSPSFNDLVAFGAAMGMFSFNKTLDYNTSVVQPYIPAVYTACPGCPIAIGLRIQDNQPPTGLFSDGTMSFSFTNAILELSAKNVSDSFYTPLLDVYANLSFTLFNFSVDNNPVTNETHVKFEASLSELSLLPDYSIVGSIDFQNIGQLLQGLLQAYILPDFNAHFKGFRLNVMKDGFGLDDWVMIITQDSIYLGANVVIPS